LSSDAVREITLGSVGRTVLILTLLLIGASTAGCGTSHDSSAQPQNPLTLLPRHPLLPNPVYYTPQELPPGGSFTYDYRKVPGPEFPQGGDVCKGGRGAARSWTPGGKFASPMVFVRVCTYSSEAKARGAYDSDSLYKQAGYDWPNYEPGMTRNERVPTAVDTLNALTANDYEIGCGLGDSNKGCDVWLFRARFRRVTWTADYITTPGAITFEQMRALIRSVDREIAANAVR
jgi:hypothetical protein